MALPGISNGNEFYSAHYLESVLTNDIKKVRERWAEEARAQVEADPSADATTPEALFKALSKPWQKLRETEFGISGEPAERLRLQRELFFKPLLEALGYPYAPKPEPLLIGGEAYQVPLLAEVSNAKGEPWLWVVECFNPSDEPADPLELNISGRQIHDATLGKVLEGETWETLISERIFGQEIPPRWLLAVSRDQLLLIDRQKWAASRLLRFELGTLLGDVNADALLAAATLLHREHTCPSGGGTPYLDELDENSHKHAYEVSGDLKYALRKSIELLGNETIHWIKQQKEGIYKGKTDAEQLTRECLRYMYRLLFLFYIESRPDLGYAPMGSDVYRLGYSLESLREMDTAELGSEEDKEGTYISDSLNQLFQMIWEGYPKRGEMEAVQPEISGSKPEFETFQIVPLRSHLFDPERLPIISGLIKDEKGEKRWPKVRFRNVVLREVIELMSLTKEGKGKRRGRVSYSQLGINQLGAVYEALLSFRGFFAEEDLFEVQPAPKKAKATASDDDDEPEDSNEEEDSDDTDNATASGQEHNELEVGHFVSAEQLKAYRAEEIVAEKDTGKPRCHPKGSFIYRLAGRDREKSASYYTPDSLTQCLVKYALKELLPGKTAAEILQLKVCEPAMGSAAFLNEVVNQLAQAYLELRQQETGRSVPHDAFQQELQKVKMRLADQNVFGIDLNPVAVELAEVSLWLNSIFSPEKGRAFVPWFSQQLVCGNSLIGARRQIYRVSQLPTEGKKAKPSKGQGHKLWHEHAPEELAWEAELPKDGIFHFLLPDPGMAAYKDKVIKELEPEAIECCQKWNKAFVGEAFSESQISHLLRLSKLVDDLWKAWAEQQKQLRLRTTDPLPVWPESETTGANDVAWTSLKLKDRIQEQEVNGRDVANTNARLRLKWAMDYWTALWFWPIRQAGSLPSRDTWLLELSMILGDLEQGVAPELGQGQLFADTQPKQLAVDFSDRHGFVDVEKLKAEFERLRQVEVLAKRIRPLHWDLEFADLLAGGGFDLIVGNPPWLKIEWNQADVLCDFNPLAIIRELEPIEEEELAKTAYETSLLFSDTFLSEHEETSGKQLFLGAIHNFVLLKGIKTNLYKGFIQSFTGAKLKSSGLTSLLHPEGVYEDAKGGALRRYIYPKLVAHFQFSNSKKLFEIGHRFKFSINIYKGADGPVDFISISNLLMTKTIDESLEVNFKPLEHGIKLPNGTWNTGGSPERVLRIREDELRAFSKLFEGRAQTALEGRLPAVFSEKLLTALSKIAKCREYSDQNIQYVSTEMWDEKKDRKKGIIVRHTGFNAKTDNELILSGPNFGLGSYLYQTPRRVCKTHGAYDPIAIENIHWDYKPRTNYITTLSNEEYRASTQSLPWDAHRKVLDEFRIIARRRIDPTHERTLKACLIPREVGHIRGSISLAFRSSDQLISAIVSMSSIVSDFLVKASGKGDFQDELIKILPYQAPCAKSTALVLMLNCLSPSFSGLWSELFSESMNHLTWTKNDSRLCNLHFKNLKRDLDYHSAIRSHFVRRHALVEVDVIVAMGSGLTLDELIRIYNLQFPVLKQSEENTWYDRQGKVVYSSSKALSGIGLPTKSKRKGATFEIGWEDIRHMTSGTVSRTIIDDTLPGGPVERTITYEAPFDLCDRVKDYRVAWEFFEKEGIDA